MAKKKQKRTKPNGSDTNAAKNNTERKYNDYAQAVFRERCTQFPKNGTRMGAVYEGLDFDSVRAKRRISAAVTLTDEIQERFSGICPDRPDKFSLAEDWIEMNAYPVSAYDYVEKFVYSTLGAAIWILDYLRDNGKLSELDRILSKSPALDNAPMPEVWDACHSQHLLGRIVAIICNRNSDCKTIEKAVKKHKTSVCRVYMDRPTAENKIDHNSPSRTLYDSMIRLIDSNSLSELKEYYTEKYWDWIRRYFLCRELFLAEEIRLEAAIEDLNTRAQALMTQNTRNKKGAESSLLLSGAMNNIGLPTSIHTNYQNHHFQMKALEHQSNVLYKRQNELNASFSSFTRELGEFCIMSRDAISEKYGSEIADIWSDFEVNDPYSMCMAFLLHVDSGSDLPWCYFAGVNLQSFYVCMLPWTRTKHISSCNNIWEHYDPQTQTITPGPSDAPLPKKIKVPEKDDWYKMQYSNAFTKDSDSNGLYNLSQILYEITGCIMPRKPERYHQALNTLNKYGINSKKANHHLLTCIALLDEAKHQSICSQYTEEQIPEGSDLSDHVPETLNELQEQVIALKAELSHCRQMLQDANAEVSAVKKRHSEIQKQSANRELELLDMARIVFGSGESKFSLGVKFPYRTASHIIVFGANSNWICEMNDKLPDVIFFDRFIKGSSETLRNADVAWIQTNEMSFDEYQRIIAELKKHHVPVRYFTDKQVSVCAAQLVNADIASC